MDHTGIPEEGLIFFLHTAGKALTSMNPAVGSYFNIHRWNLSGRLNLDLPSDGIKKNVSCMRCLSPWSYNHYMVKVRPALKPNVKIRSAMRKKENMQKCSFMVEKLAVVAHPGNNLVLKCLVCHKKTSFMISKNLKQISTSSNVKKAKKKKKKDNLAGLLFANSSTSSGGLVLGETSCMHERVSSLAATYTKRKTCKLEDQHIEKEGQNFLRLNVVPLGSKPDESSQRAKTRRKEDEVPNEKKFLNPFALSEGSKRKKKKMDHLQRMVKNQVTENRKKSAGFRDLLSLVS